MRFSLECGSLLPLCEASATDGTQCAEPRQFASVRTIPNRAPLRNRAGASTRTPGGRPLRYFVILTFLACGSTAAYAAGEIEGFTEPYRRLQVAAAEPGVIEALEVQEGSRVTVGQPVAHLDRDSQRAALEVARRTMESRGQLVQAKAELLAAETRLTKLRQLLDRKHASAEEVDKAERDRDVAAARVQLATESAAVHAAEFERLKVQLDRRTVRSPIDGVVTDIRRNVGEFALPTDPTVMTIVQLNPLRATFSVPADRIAGLEAGKPATVRLSTSKTPIAGDIEFVSPVTTAQSGTVIVKVRFPNPDYQHRAGEKCELILTTPAPQMTRTNPTAPR